MKVQVPFEFSRQDLLAVATHLGLPRPANKLEMTTWVEGLVRATLASLSATAEHDFWDGEAPGCAAVLAIDPFADITEAP